MGSSKLILAKGLFTEHSMFLFILTLTISAIVTNILFLVLAYQQPSQEGGNIYEAKFFHILSHHKYLKSQVKLCSANRQEIYS
jgi:hypothetical protein